MVWSRTLFTARTSFLRIAMTALWGAAESNRKQKISSLFECKIAVRVRRLLHVRAANRTLPMTACLSRLSAVFPAVKEREREEVPEVLHIVMDCVDALSWRRGWDSNPYALSGYCRFSKPGPYQLGLPLHGLHRTHCVKEKLIL